MCICMGGGEGGGGARKLSSSVTLEWHRPITYPDGKKSRSGMNIPDHFPESLETILRVKNTKILLGGSGSGIRNLFDPGSEIRDGKIRIRDPG